MSHQQRRERALIIPKPQAPGPFERMRTRAATILGREDGLGAELEQEKEKRAKTKGRVRGETIVTPSMHDAIGERSDESGQSGGNDEKHGNGRVGASSGANGHGYPSGYGAENGHENGNGYHYANGNGHSNLPNNPPLPPPTFTQTAPTPPPPRTILPELGETDSPSPGDDTRGDYVAPSPHVRVAPAASARPRPRSLALGHESDYYRKRHLRDRSGTIRVGDVYITEDEEPEGGENDEKKSEDVEGRDNER